LDHEEVVRLMFPEKYLLNELSPELRDEFIEHLFDCTECVADLGAGASFVKHTKVILAAEHS